PDSCQVPLALELAAAEDRVALGINGFLEVKAGPRWPADRGVAVAEIARQPAEDEAVKSRVIGRDLEPERCDRPPPGDLDRVRGVDAQNGVCPCRRYWSSRAARRRTARPVWARARRTAR